MKESEAETAQATELAVSTEEVLEELQGHVEGIAQANLDLEAQVTHVSVVRLKCVGRCLHCR